MLHFQVTVVEVEREGAQFVQVEAYDARGVFRWEMRRAEWVEQRPTERNDVIAGVVRTFLAGERS